MLDVPPVALACYSDSCCCFCQKWAFCKGGEWASGREGGQPVSWEQKWGAAFSFERSPGEQSTATKVSANASKMANLLVPKLR